MKRVGFLLICGFQMLFFIGCQEAIDVELPPTEERLVVDALMRIPDNDTFLVEAYLKLTRTANYYADTIPTVSDALVYLTTSNETYTLQPEENGFYSTILPRSELTTGNMILNIEYEGELYEASTQYFPAVPIDSVIQGEESLFSEDETEVVITYTDLANEDNFYLFDLDKGQFLASEDTFYKDRQFSFSYFYEDLNVQDTLDIDLIGINKPFFDYMTVLLNQTGQASGNPFVPPPSTVRGNIVNTTNKEHYPLGYFAIGAVYSASIIIE